MLIPLLLLLHVLVAVGLLGAITHQAAAVLRQRPRVRAGQLIARYAAVESRLFVQSIVVLYIASIVLGALIYPTYRLDARIALEELGLYWAVGLFELKEHLGGLGLAVLPLYAFHWRAEAASVGPRAGLPPVSHAAGRIGTTLTLCLIVWFDFIAGHILNNLRGL